MMKSLAFPLLLLAAIAVPTTATKADTFREFQGRNPAEIQKKAYQSGYQYPESDVECKSNGYCYQKWGKSN